MKKILAFVLIVILMLSMLCACSTGGNDTAGGADNSGGGNKAIKLASHNATVEGSSYRVRYEKDMQDAAAAAADYGYDISYACFVSNWDAATEAQQLENSINEGYDVIIINPVASTGLDLIIEKAKEAGITYVNADTEYFSKEIINVCTDQNYLGYKSASYAGDKLGKGAKVVMINAIDGNSANEQREAGFEQGIAEKGLEVVGYYNHNWDDTLCQQLMTEIINSGLEFDGVLVSQGGNGVLGAYEATGAAWPKFVGFADDGAYAQKLLKINKESEVLPYIVVSNPPGVGASALNFAINMMLGHELRDDIFDNPDYNSIYLESRIWYTYDNQEEYRAEAEALAANDVFSYWLTIDEVREGYFK